MRISDWSSDVCSSDLFASDTKINSIHQEGQEIVLAVTSQGQDAFIRGTDVLVAVGRVPNTHGLEVDKTDVALDERGRSEERRVGKEGVSPCQSRWWADH